MDKITYETKGKIRLQIMLSVLGVFFIISIIILFPPLILVTCILLLLYGYRYANQIQKITMNEQGIQFTSLLSNKFFTWEQISTIEYDYHIEIRLSKTKVATIRYRYWSHCYAIMLLTLINKSKKYTNQRTGDPAYSGISELLTAFIK